MALVTTNYGQDKGFSWTGATGSTIGPFNLSRGKYALVAEAAGTTTTLLVNTPAGNYVAAYSATTAAVFQTLDLPAGQYKVVVSSTSAVSGFLGFISLGR